MRNADDFLIDVEVASEARSAWDASVQAALQNDGEALARRLLWSALESRVPRVALVLALRTASGPRWTALVGRPEYELCAVLPHFALTLKAAAAPLSSGDHLVVLMARPGAHHERSVSFELMNSWEARLPPMLQDLSRFLDPELSDCARELATHADMRRSAIAASINSHELGHWNGTWPVQPREPAWLQAMRARGRRSGHDWVRIACNALGDLAADIHGPSAGETRVRLVTLAYHWDNLRRGTPLTDADHLVAALIFEAFFRHAGSGRRLLSSSGLDELYSELGCLVARLTALARDGRLDRDDIDVSLPVICLMSLFDDAAPREGFARSLVLQDRLGEWLQDLIGEIEGARGTHRQ